MPDPAPIRPASTILLLRDSSDGLEVFMVVRHHQIDFASGALVFPGGKVDPEDDAPTLHTRLDGATAGHEVFQVAAIREAYEESGVLLARESGTNALISGARLRELDSARAALNSGELTFEAFLEREDLRLAADLLIPFAHWITPSMVPKRFDTWFYLAVAPAEHLAIHDGSESVDSVWIRPQDAIDDAAAGRRTIIFPTLCNVEKIGAAASVDDALARAQADTIVEILPWPEKREDGNYICIPADAGYPVSEQKMPDRGPV